MSYSVVFLESQTVRESTEITCPCGIRRSIMVVTWKFNDPANKPPPHFCPMLSCTKGGWGGGGVIWYSTVHVHLDSNKYGPPTENSVTEKSKINDGMNRKIIY